MIENCFYSSNRTLQHAKVTLQTPNLTQDLSLCVCICLCIHCVCVSPLSFVWLIIWEAWQEDRFISWNCIPPPPLSLPLRLCVCVCLSLSYLPPSSSLCLFVCLNGSVYVCVSRRLCARVCVKCDLAVVWCEMSVCVHISILLMEVDFQL